MNNNNNNTANILFLYICIINTVVFGEIYSAENASPSSNLTCDIFVIRNVRTYVMLLEK